MSAHLVLSCDGHRHGQPCRGALHTRTLDWDDAADEARAAGWRIAHLAPDPDLCPSAGHDEDRP